MTSFDALISKHFDVASLIFPDIDSSPSSAAEPSKCIIFQPLARNIHGYKQMKANFDQGIQFIYHFRDFIALHHSGTLNETTTGALGGIDSNAHPVAISSLYDLLESCKNSTVQLALRSFLNYAIDKQDQTKQDNRNFRNLNTEISEFVSRLASLNEDVQREHKLLSMGLLRFMFEARVRAQFQC